MGGEGVGASARDEPADAILAVFADSHRASARELYSHAFTRPQSHGHRLQSQEEDRPHRLRAEARAPGHQAQRRQHGAAFASSAPSSRTCRRRSTPATRPRPPSCSRRPSRSSTRSPTRACSTRTRRRATRAACRQGEGAGDCRLSAPPAKTKGPALRALFAIGRRARSPRPLSASSIRMLDDRPARCRARSS